MKKLFVCVTPGVSETAFPLLGKVGFTKVLHMVLGNKTEVATGTVQLSLNLDRVEYEKRVYAPGTADLSFTISSPGNSGASVPLSLKSFFLEEECLVDVFGFNCRTALISSLTRISLLENYYVHNIEFRSEANSMLCVFKCFSYDHHLTLVRGSEIFTGKRFGLEIFKDKLDSMSDWSGKYLYEPGRMLMMGYNKELSYRDGYHTETNNSSGKDTIVRNSLGMIDIFKTIESNKKNKSLFGHDEELKHPYLVRYNESLYDFMVRIAHRCGEFLYFDGGKLCLGLPLDTIGKIVDKTECVKSLSSPICSYSSLLEEDTHDSVGHCDNYVDPPKSLSNAVADGIFDMQWASEEYLHQITADDAVKNCLNGWVIWRRSFAGLFTADKFIKGIGIAVILAIIESINESAVLPGVMAGDIKKFIGDDAQDSSKLELTGEIVGQNLQNSFYHRVEELEKKAERCAVTINFLNTVPEYQIGDAINPDDGLFRFYVVSGVYGSYSYENCALKSQNFVEAVPVQPVKDFDGLSAVAVPPAGDIPISLKSSPKEAIVVRTDDPLRLGRVRVRYPWQPWDNPDDVKNTTTPLSPWIRVTVPYAGGKDTLGSAMMTPDEGEHVMLDFVDGNIERPYVDGSFFFRYEKDGNVWTHSPHRGSLPYDTKKQSSSYKTRVISSAHGHSLTFQDNDDTTLIGQSIPFFKTLSSIAGCTLPRDRMLKPRSLERIPFGVIKGGGVMLSDGSQMCSVEVNPDTRSIDINSKFGSVSMNAFTGITINAPNGDITIKGKNVSIEAGNNISIRSGANIRHTLGKGVKGGNVCYGIGMALGVGVGKGLLGSMLKSTTGVDLSKMCDLSYIRNILEIVLRPVEGTLTLQSERNVVMTAGVGLVSIPQGLLSKAKWMTADKHGKLGPMAGGFSDGIVSVQGGLANGNTVGDFSGGKTVTNLEIPAIRIALSEIDSFYKNVIDSWNNLNDSIIRLLTDIKSTRLFDFLKNPNYEDYQSKRDNLEICFQGIRSGESSSYMDLFNNMSDEEKESTKKLRDKVEKTYKKIIKKAQTFEKNCFNLSGLQKAFDDKLPAFGFSVAVTSFPSSYRTTFYDKNSNPDRWGMTYEEMNKILNVTELEIKTRSVIMKRSAVVQILSQSKTLELAASSEDARDTLIEIKDNMPANNEVAYFDKQNISHFEKYIFENDKDNKYTWGQVAKAIVDAEAEPAPGKLKSFRSGFLSGITNHLLGGGGEYNRLTGQWTLTPSIKKLFNINGISGPRAFADTADVGNILISNKKGTTLMLNGEMNAWETHRNGNAQAVSDAIVSLNLNL